MIGNFVQLMLKRTSAPHWFYLDKKHKVPDIEIQEKIRIEIYTEVINNQYNRLIWDDLFIAKVANLYYRFFNQLYSQNS